MSVPAAARAQTHTLWDEAARSPWRATLALTLLGLAGAFVITVVLPYLALDRASFGRAPEVFWPRRYGLLLHISGGMLALLLVPIQLWLGLTQRNPVWHRRLGKLYLAGVAAGAAGAFYLSFTSPIPAGLSYHFGLFMLGVVWVMTTGMAWLAIRRRQIDWHRDWMIRSMIVTFAFVTFRITETMLEWADMGSPADRLAVAAWTCWAVPLLLAEPVLQWRAMTRAQRGVVPGVRAVA
ncbi:MAG TPA: DUF2306 domain-containing protein [Xanthomonadaceae bacterium]|nr:DUF2306 domain-containing protein [Xanthomonadaceae bacterium]